MEKQYKVLMLCFPATGHFNPFVCYARELAKNKNVKVIMYSNQSNRKVIEAGNIEFREANLEIPMNEISVTETRKNMPVHKLLNFFIDGAEMLLPELVRCVDEEGIDLIIYDFMTVYAKWLIKRLNFLHQKGKLKRAPPKALMFAPSVLHQKGIYPNSFEDQFVPKPKLTLSFVFRMLLFFVRYITFTFRYSLPIDNPVELIFYTKEKLNICCVVPEFQPRSHLFPNTIRFVGDCAAEEVRCVKEFEEPLKSFLEPFEVRNPLPLTNLKVDDSLLKGDSQLIYVSFGTLVNTDIRPFLQVIEGIKAINRAAPQKKLRFLMSTGDISYATFQDMIKKKEIEMPENVLIMPRVPQLDVLKRTSLFITHSGQGSTSEAINYGVPMVCIPVMGDQPAVAYRTADELGLGIRLDFDDLNTEAIKSAVLTVLNDKSYLERTLLFSQISRKYNGTKEASRITIEYLQASNKNKSD